MENVTARTKPVPQEIYRHFKGENKLYQIITIARNTETEEEMVVYQALYGDFLVYARPLEMFMSEVDKQKYPDEKAVYRFEKVIRTGEAKPFGENGTSVDENSKCTIIEKDRNADGDEGKLSKSCECEKEMTKESEEYEESGVSTYLLEFLDAENYEQKRNLLIHLRPKMSDRLIDDIAMSMDIEVEQGDIEARYASLLKCIETLGKYEITR